MKTGLVMEGGAMRGMFTAGVIDIWMENGIDFDGAIGISAGAVFGCNIKSRQIGRVIRYNKRFCRNPKYCSLKSWIKTGDLYGADFCYREIPDKLDPFDVETYRKNPMKFYVGATDVDTGKPVYFRCDTGDAEDIKKMQASASMPIVSRTVNIEGHRLLDGGMVDPIPLKFMQRKGYDRNVVLLTQPKGYRKKKSKGAGILHFLTRKYPALAHDMDIRFEIYNRQLDEVERQEKEGSILAIRPPKALDIGKTEKNPKELERVYQIGRQEGQKTLDQVREFLILQEASIPGAIRV